MADRVDVRFKGLKELDRALRRADKALHVVFRAKVKSIAEDVAKAAVFTADQKGLRESGDLIRGIQPFVRTDGAGVRSGAVHRGFNYPRRLEFEGRGGGMFGPRASLYPALEEDRSNWFAAAELLLDGVVDDLGRD